MTLGQIGHGTGQQSTGLIGPRGVRPSEQLAGEHPSAPRPRAQQRLVDQLTLVVDRCTRLAPPVHLDARGIKVERHRLARIPPELTVELIRDQRECLLGRTQVRAPETPRQLARSRGRRSVSHRPQLATGASARSRSTSSIESPPQSIDSATHTSAWPAERPRARCLTRPRPQPEAHPRSPYRTPRSAPNGARARRPQQTPRTASASDHQRRSRPLAPDQNASATGHHARARPAEPALAWSSPTR